jgi:hypothetical protein
VLVQGAFEMHEVTTLPQAHFLGETGQLVQVRRKIGYAPDAGLRKVVKFHACAQSDFRANAFSATVCAATAGSQDVAAVTRK